MTAPAAIGLTYRGTNIQQSDLGIFLELESGYNEPPTVRGEDLVVPGLAGRMIGSRVRDVRRIVLNGLVQGTSGSEPTSFRTLANTLIALFDPTISGNLVATLEDATTKTIACRTLNVLWKAITPYAALVSVEMESIAPDWT